MLERTNLSLMLALGLLVTTACASDASREDDSELPDASPTDPGTDATDTDETDTDVTPGEPTTQPEAGAPHDGGDPEPAPPEDGGSDPEPGDAGEHPGTDAGAEDPDAGGENPDDTDGGAPEQDGGAPGEDDPWSECPEASSVVDEPNSPLTFEVSEEAVYCATFNESRTLQEELAAKMQLRLTPGSYRLPASEQADVALPACLWSGMGAATPATAGEIRYSSSEFDGSVSHSLSAQVTFQPASERLLRLRFDRTSDAGEPADFLIDGRESGLDFDAYHSFELCEVDEADCFPERLFVSCEYETGLLNLHEVTFDGGEVAFELRLGDSFAGTEPGAFVRASGTFAGQAFDQTDYFELVYHPTHHHFERTFAVFFDEPIDGACGLEVTALEPFGDDVPDQAFTVDCELNRLQELTVTAHELTRE